MSYHALYRQYRPSRFCEVVGQEHITDVLRNQIRTGRIAHAYLFSGSRGTGKTSTARILARAVNCLDPIQPRALPLRTLLAVSPTKCHVQKLK